ncbi:DUF418 domain-containing protein (plasmid) [Streptomyces sp. NBC_01450]|uniref:DUF418 domain-containing protein n=1 Tax=Streptomyces sp. NBC_01450 TaxID=2903871 RepID=UPI002E2F9A8D|nr:DUF418 domain-containing protein [Streptomyces sp. NBC_01450]
MTGTRGNRLPRVDALRGFALLGILVVNAQIFAGTWSLPVGPGTPPADRAAVWLITVLFNSKFYLLFAFVFGYSFVLQEKAAARAGVLFTGRHLRRVLGLFLMGLTHAVLLYPGDILVTYAVVGLILFAVRRLSARAALGAAAALTVLLATVFLVVGVLSLGVDGGHLTTQTGQAETARLAAGYRGGPLSVVRTNIEEYRRALGGVLVYGLHLVAAALTGYAAGRKGLLDPSTPVSARTAALRGRLVAVALPTGLAGGVFTAMCTYGPLDPRCYYLGQAVDILTAPLLTAVYVTAVLSLPNGRFGRRIVGALAAAGRTSLSHYLLQSAVMAFVFTGYGLARYGTVGPATLVCACVALWTVQLAVSARFPRIAAHGPAETLLRRVTSGRPAPR